MVKFRVEKCSTFSELKEQTVKISKKKAFCSTRILHQNMFLSEQAYGVIFISKNKAFFMTSRLQSRSLFRTNGHNQQEQNVVQHEEDSRAGPYLEQKVLTSLEQKVMNQQRRKCCAARGYLRTCAWSWRRHLNQEPQRQVAQNRGDKGTGRELTVRGGVSK